MNDPQAARVPQIVYTRRDNRLKNAIVLGLPFAFTFVSLNQAYNCRVFFPVFFRFPRIDGLYQPETEGIFQPAPTTDLF